LIFSLLCFLFRLPNRRRRNFAGNRAAIAQACADRGLYVAAAIHSYLTQLLLAIQLFVILHYIRQNTKDRVPTFLSAGAAQAFVTDDTDWGGVACGW
jgi:hypothetical protein